MESLRFRNDDLATEKIVALKGQFSITKEMYLKDLIMSRTRTLC